MNDTRENYVKDKVVIVTGASNGFGLLAAKRIAEMGGIPVLAARSEDKLKAAVAEIKAAGGEAAYTVTDVSKYDQVQQMAKFVIDTFGRIDVLVNNAGTMPLAFYSDHPLAMQAWEQCLDICLRGTLYCTCAVYDQMMAQGRGQVINISSIWGNYPASGAAVYQVAKKGVEYLGESLRSEAQGKIKVTIIKPTGFGGTGLTGAIVNPMAGMSLSSDILGVADWMGTMTDRPDYNDINSMAYSNPDPQILADNIVYAIDQPWGVSVSNLTVRATGEKYCL